MIRADLPIGLQIMGGAFDEATVRRVAHAYEGATEWHEQRPKLEKTRRGQDVGKNSSY